MRMDADVIFADLQKTMAIILLLLHDVFKLLSHFVLCRPTMIKYKISNIRDLIGHKVDLEMVNRNPICLLEKA